MAANGKIVSTSRLVNEAYIHIQEEMEKLTDAGVGYDLYVLIDGVADEFGMNAEEYKIFDAMVRKNLEQ